GSALSATTVALLFRFSGLPQSFTSLAWVAVVTFTVHDVPCARSPKLQPSVCEPVAPVTEHTGAGPLVHDGAGVPMAQLRLAFGSGSASSGLNRTFTAVPGPLFVTTIEKLIVSPALYVPPSGVFTMASTGLSTATGSAPHALVAELLFASPPYDAVHCQVPVLFARNPPDVAAAPAA